MVRKLFLLVVELSNVPVAQVPVVHHARKHDLEILVSLGIAHVIYICHIKSAGIHSTQCSFFGIIQPS
ncbi:MAG: hypothetical protein ACK55Z_11910, partial [bacterium]